MKLSTGVVLNHFDVNGKAVMVNVEAKETTYREAEAAGEICLQMTTIEKILEGKIGKGDVLGVARIAGIMAAKNAAGLVPLCHNVVLTGATLNFEVLSDRVLILARVSCCGQTGVEMEALTAVSAAALTIYDMVKAIDREAVISNIRLLLKKGGKSGLWEREEGPVC
jgi:cyclic pyranopterin phosphate synthase